MRIKTEFARILADTEGFRKAAMQAGVEIDRTIKVIEHDRQIAWQKQCIREDMKEENKNDYTSKETRDRNKTR